MKIAAGTLYGAVENLLKQGLIESVKSEDKRRKVYVITERGKEVLHLDFMMNAAHLLRLQKSFITRIVWGKR